MMNPLCLFCLLGATLALAPAADPPRGGDTKKPGESATASKAGPEGKPDGKEKLDEPKRFDIEWALKQKPPESVNGTTLRIRAEQLLQENTDRILVEWTIRYAGPRKPLAILRPSVTDTTFGQTRLNLYAVGKSGECYVHMISSPGVHSPLLLGPSKDWFVRTRETATGHFLVETGDLRRYLRRRVPDEFDPARPPKAYAALIHQPTDRGEEFNLDAWTGRLESDLVPLKLKEW